MMNRSTMFIGWALGAALSACQVEEDAVAKKSEPAPALASTPVALYSGFSGPERVLYDVARDRYLVSNVNGTPDEKDGNGFISVLSPDGSVSELEWIRGGEGGVELDAPKGLAIVGGVLYVADIDTVRLFDVETGEPNGAISIPRSTFLNGVTATEDGRVYVSDSGPPRGTLDAVGTEAVYVIEGDQVRKVARGALGRPTSLEAHAGGVIVASFGSNEVYALDANGKRKQSSKLPAGGLAGVVKFGDWVYVTSWQASAIFAGTLGEPFEQVLGDLPAPSDLGFDSVRGRFLIPHFTDDTVTAVEFAPSAEAVK